MTKRFFQISSISLSTLTALIFAVSPSFAGNMTSFQHAQCPNPGGNQVANFQDGWHWIPGYSQNMWGKDSVHDIGNQNYVQCFCPLPHAGQAWMSGVQSNWQAAGNYTASEQQQLINSDWQLRHDGTAFGLPQNDYFVKNYSFSCDKNIEGEGGSHVSIQRNTVTTVVQSNNANVSTSVSSHENTGGNNANSNTQGNVEVITGNASSTTKIDTSANNNTIDGLGQTMRQMFQDMRVNISGNGASSDNSVHISSF